MSAVNACTRISLCQAKSVGLNRFMAHTFILHLCVCNFTAPVAGC